MLTVDVIALDETPSPLPHHHSVGVAMTDEVIAQDWITSSTDVRTTPLILPYHVPCWKRKGVEFVAGSLLFKQ